MFANDSAGKRALDPAANNARCAAKVSLVELVAFGPAFRQILQPRDDDSVHPRHQRQQTRALYGLRVADRLDAGERAEQKVAKASGRFEYDDFAVIIRRLMNDMGVGYLCGKDEPEARVQL